MGVEADGGSVSAPVRPLPPVGPPQSRNPRRGGGHPPALREGAAGVATGPRALLAAHVVALPRGPLRAQPARPSTPLYVWPLGVGGNGDVVELRLWADDIALVARARGPEAA